MGWLWPMGPQELPALVLMLYKGASLLSRDRLERTVADRNIKVYSTRHDR